MIHISVLSPDYVLYFCIFNQMTMFCIFIWYREHFYYLTMLFTYYTWKEEQFLLYNYVLYHFMTSINEIELPDFVLLGFTHDGSGWEQRSQYYGSNYQIYLQGRKSVNKRRQSCTQKSKSRDKSPVRVILGKIFELNIFYWL